jgi:hypothetical protein
MSKYRVRYEEAMNPFEAFRGRVSCCGHTFLIRCHVIDIGFRKRRGHTNLSTRSNEASLYSLAPSWAIAEHGLLSSSTQLLSTS